MSLETLLEKGQNMGVFIKKIWVGFKIFLEKGKNQKQYSQKELGEFKNFFGVKLKYDGKFF